MKNDGGAAFPNYQLQQTLAAAQSGVVYKQDLPRVIYALENALDRSPDLDTALRNVRAALIPAMISMRSNGWDKNKAGYTTDAMLWLEETLKRIDEYVAPETEMIKARGD